MRSNNAGRSVRSRGDVRSALPEPSGTADCAHRCRWAAGIQRHIRQVAERECVVSAHATSSHCSKTVLHGRPGKGTGNEHSAEINNDGISNLAQVSASSPLYGSVPIFPMRTIILGRSNCDVPAVTPPAPGTPTCRALQGLQSGLPTCYLNQACTGLNCAVLGLPYTVAFEVEPCTQPASILLMVRDATGSVLYNSSINDTTIVPLGSNISLYVVVRQLPNALGLKVSLFSCL